MSHRKDADTTESKTPFFAGHWPSLVLGLMVAAYVGYFAWLTLRAFDHFVYQAYDLGIYDQAVWNTVQGRPFRSTLEPPYDSLLGDHFEPILLPIALVYALWESPKVLLLIQTIVLALGAVPVYLLARDGMGRRLAKGGGVGQGSLPYRASVAFPSVELVALGFALVYLLYPPVHSANVFEFHPSALALSFLLYAVLFMRRRRFALYVLFLVLTMSTKEVMPLSAFALGLYALLFERQRVAGLATMAISALWFALAVFVAIPHFSPEGQSQYFTEYYGWLGGTPATAIAQMIHRPGTVWQRLIEADSLQYIERLLRPWVYTPLPGLPILLVAAPAMLLNVLSDFSFQLRSLNFFQYAAAIAPFVVVAAVDGTALLSRSVGSFLDGRWPSAGRRFDARFAVAGTVVVLSLVLSWSMQRYHGFLPFSLDYYLAPRNAKVLAAESLVRQVPAEDTVSADLIFGPHLSQRQDLYLYPSVNEADYIVVDATYRDAPFPPRDRYDALQTILREGEYGVVDGNYGYLLLKRGVASQTIPEGFYRFAIAEKPEPQYRVDLVFGDALRLTGFDLVWERPVRPHAHLLLYWEALRPIERDLRLFFVLTDPLGEIVPGTEMEFDASVWMPPSRWAEGETIRTATLPWSLEDPARFGVAVGVVEGPGFWELEKRLEPTVGSSPWPMPQVHDGSLVWLTTVFADGRLALLERPGESR